MDDLLILLVYYIAGILLVFFGWTGYKLFPDKRYILRGVGKADITHVIPAGGQNRLCGIARKSKGGEDCDYEDKNIPL